MKCPLKIDHYENRPALTVHLFKPPQGFIFLVRTDRPDTCVEAGAELLVDFKDGSTITLENSSENCKGDYANFLSANDDVSSFLEGFEEKTIAVLRSATNDAIRQNLSYGESTTLRTTLQCFRELDPPAAKILGQAWSPPRNPDPAKIIREARVDRQQGNYEVALAKHIWYHDNALKIDRSLTGVRLSYALADWRQLANRYPPALRSLEETRDLNETRVRANKDDFEAFQEYAALNRELMEEEKTAILFKWVHENDPVYARAIYPLARDALVQFGEWDLCSTYTDREQYDETIPTFRKNLKWATEQNWNQLATDGFRQLFSYDIALTIAILSKAGRSVEARELSELATLAWKDPSHHQRLKNALKGTPPDRLF